MQLSLEDVSHVAWLARLALGEDEKKRLAGHLNQIIEHFAALQDVDTSDVDAVARVLPLVNVYREDVAGESLPRQSILAGGPRVNEEAFIVPRVVDTADGKSA